MAKFKYETKKKVVQSYLSGEGGANYVGEKYGVSKSTVQKWIAAYNEFGDEGLKRSRRNKTYSFEFKLHVVELYLREEVSYQDLALSVGINNPPLIARWVNDFRILGPDALRRKRKGRKKTMKNLGNPTSNEQSQTEQVITDIEHIKQLEDELLKLRIENAYLKELRRLRLEEETLLKKQQESSTASEENSN